VENINTRESKVITGLTIIVGQVAVNAVAVPKVVRNIE
jgi:hypothetical protein